MCCVGGLDPFVREAFKTERIEDVGNVIGLYASRLSASSGDGEFVSYFFFPISSVSLRYPVEEDEIQVAIDRGPARLSARDSRGI